MRGIIHLEDLHRRPPWTRHALLDWIGEPPTSEAIFAAYPPPELIVVGTQQDFERLRPWLNECEIIMRPETPEQARALLIAGECWRPEAPGAVEPPPPRPGGDWWPLGVGEATHPGELAAAIRGLELRWEDKHYSLLDGSSRPLTPKSPDLARFPEYRLAMRGGRCRFDWIWQCAGQECAVAMLSLTPSIRGSAPAPASFWVVTPRDWWSGRRANCWPRTSGAAGESSLLTRNPQLNGPFRSKEAPIYCSSDWKRSWPFSA